MTLQPVVSVGGGAAVLYADVVSGTVVGAELVVPAGKQAVVEYASGSTVVIEGAFGPGTHTRSVPKNKRFSVTADNTRVSLTIDWPG